MKRENQRQRANRISGFQSRQMVLSRRALEARRVSEKRPKLIVRVRTSKYERHQGIRECNRRRRRLNPFQTEIRSQLLFTPKS